MRPSLRAFFLTAVLLLAAVQGTWAQYINQVKVIGHKNKNDIGNLKTQYMNQGWTVIDKDLNEGTKGAIIYLVYKTGSTDGITGFYLRVSDRDDSPATLSYNGRKYYRAECDGSDRFKSSRGDLNNEASGKYIHLYYTKDDFMPKRYITNVIFNDSSYRSVPENGNSSSCDLNKGAGGKYIYMHEIKVTAQEQADISSEVQLKEVVSHNGANIRLTSDIKLSGLLDIPFYDHKIIIDLNGHTIDRGLRASAGAPGHVLQIRGSSTVTLKDSAGGGSLTGGYADNGGAIWIGDSATLIMESGTIRDCRSTGTGAAICNNSTFILKGGTIRNCTATGDGGIYNNGTLTISGGTIQDILSDDGGAIYNVEGRTTTITGGLFKGNRTVTYGGGAITNKGTLVISGGTFTANCSKGNGGGIYQGGTLKLSGNPVISDNTRGSSSGPANNLYIPSGKKMSVTGAFTQGARIGLTPQVAIDVMSSGYAAHNPNADPAGFFFIDTDPEVYSVSLLDGELVRYQIVGAMPSYYIDLNGNSVDEPAARMISALKDVSGVSMSNGWYVVDKNTTFQNRIEILGNVNIILADNTTLNARKGIHVPYASTLHIWAQRDGSGLLKANADSPTPQVAGIGENRSQGYGEKQGEINIHGGNLSVQGGTDSPAIGGHAGKNITITGGSVIAIGGDNGAGIGCGYMSISPKNIIISGGEVRVIGGMDAAGIGTGKASRNFIPKDGSTGIVPADGLNNVRITGGYVIAYGVSGIGGGSATNPYEGCEGNVYIEGGTVVAETLVPNTPNTRDHNGQAIGHGAAASDIGTNVVFPMSGEFSVYDGAKVKAVQYYQGKEVTMPAAIRTQAFRWAQVTISPCDHPDGLPCQYCGGTGVTLFETSSNDNTLKANDNKLADVKLEGRTLYKDGSWNTLCLPFSLNNIAGTPLEGAVIKTLTGATVTDGSLTLTFGDAVTALRAGVPYIVRWNGGTDIKNPVFKSVRINNGTSNRSFSGVTFTGTFGPRSIYGDTRTILYIGTDNKLYRATRAMDINSCRAYFVLDESIQANAIKNCILYTGSVPATIDQQ